jgi:WD40 repeat protein
LDGNWITSVNHHYLKSHKLSHVKIINTKELDSPHILIGHEFPVFIAVSVSFFIKKFSKINYADNSGSYFILLATSDNKGNLIIWKIQDNSFKLLTEISNFSESTITDLVWSPYGDYLFVTNSNGSLYIIEFNEFTKQVNEAESNI